MWMRRNAGYQFGAGKVNAARAALDSDEIKIAKDKISEWWQNEKGCLSGDHR